MPTLWFKERAGQTPQQPQGESVPQPGLTFPWPRRSHGGGCSGCCTRPWSVCRGWGGGEQVPCSSPTEARGGRGGVGAEQVPRSSPTEARGGGLSRQKRGGAGRGRGGWPHEDLPAAAEGSSVGHPGVPALQEAIVPTCREMETAPAGQEAR